MQLEVEVRPGGPAGGAHVADDLPLGDAVAHVDQVLGHVAVDAAVAVAVGQSDEVAVWIGVGGPGDGTSGHRIDGGPLVLGEVHAVVEALVAEEGMVPLAIGVGDDVGAVHRGDEAGGAGGGRGAAASGQVVLVACGQPRRLLGGEGRLIGCLGLENLLAGGVLLGLVGLELGGEALLRRGQLQEQLVGLGPLGLESGLQRLQLPACLLLGFHLGPQRLPGGFDFLGLLLQVLEHPLVGLGHLPDHVDPAQQVGKAVGLKQNRPVGDVAVFLHGPQPLLVRLLHLVLGGLRRLQVALALGHQETVLL